MGHHGVVSVWSRVRHELGGGVVCDVALPEGYDDGDRVYPLVVCLDAQWTMGTVCDSALNLGLARLVPRVVVAGLGWDASTSRDVTLRRAQALTPSAGTFPVGVVPASTEPPQSGGAPAYLAQLADTVLPLLHRTYRVDPTQRTLVGHSFSGLFGLFTLLQRPELFTRYLLASPSVWWDDRVILRLPAAETAPSSGARVYLSVGELEERPGAVPMITNARAAQDRITGLGRTDLETTVDILDGEIHHSSIPASVSRGLRWLFA